MSPVRSIFALASLVLAAATAWGQVVQAPPPGFGPRPGPAEAQGPVVAPSVSGQPPLRPPPVRIAPYQRGESIPWSELTPRQQQALSPLGASWRSLSEAHKRKWLALSSNYEALPPPEQARLRSRMTEWATLSPQQRTQARLNFAESQQVDAVDKRAKWEAYQALPPEEKRRLAAGATAVRPPPPPTAPALRPVPRQNLERIPPRKRAENRRLGVVPPGQVDRNTLLPRPGILPDAP
ncbi:MAG: hypothetical protein K0S48_1643 [Ramlibacter sp.]|jgi:hypothetical protein|nr:hypothetical protein [Ramlibacter sp.]MCE3273713.1 hypothetical protein [Ramlibacter sp.]